MKKLVILAMSLFITSSVMAATETQSESHKPDTQVLKYSEKWSGCVDYTDNKRYSIEQLQKQLDLKKTKVVIGNLQNTLDLKENPILVKVKKLEFSPEIRNLEIGKSNKDIPDTGGYVVLLRDKNILVEPNKITSSADSVYLSYIAAQFRMTAKADEDPVTGVSIHVRLGAPNGNKSCRITYVSKEFQ